MFWKYALWGYGDLIQEVERRLIDGRVAEGWYLYSNSKDQGRTWYNLSLKKQAGLPGNIVVDNTYGYHDMTDFLRDILRGSRNIHKVAGPRCIIGQSAPPEDPAGS